MPTSQSSLQFSSDDQVRSICKFCHYYSSKLHRCMGVGGSKSKPGPGGGGGGGILPSVYTTPSNRTFSVSLPSLGSYAAFFTVDSRHLAGH